MGINRFSAPITANEDVAAHIGLLLVSGVIAGLVQSVLRWLPVRPPEVGGALGLMSASYTLDILPTSVTLILAVTMGASLIGVPLVFLATRTDLHYRRFRTVVVELPSLIVISGLSMIVPPRQEKYDVS